MSDKTVLELAREHRIDRAVRSVATFLGKGTFWLKFWERSGLIPSEICRIRQAFNTDKG
jgi:hypothetical protein